MARQLNYYGTSLYPKHSFPNSHWPRWRFNVAVDFSRSANLPNGGFYVGELQAGFGVRGVVVGDPVTADDQRLWLWTAIAKGARAVNFYAYYPMSSSYESGGYGLIELDGTITPRAREAGKAARLIHENCEVLLNSKPEPAQIAILYNPLAQMVGGEQNSGPAGGLRDSMIGYYRALTDVNIPVDFVHRETLESGLPEQYRLLILPYPIMFTQKAANAVRAFVECGGHVISEARLAWNDASGAAAPVVPGMGLAEVFGVREERVKMTEAVAMAVKDASHAVMGGLESKKLRGAYFAASWRPLEGAHPRVLATLEDGSPSIVANTFGKGEAVLVGSFLGLGTHPNVDTNDQRFILNLARWAGAEPALRIEATGGPGIEAVLRRGPSSSLVFLLNPTQSACNAKVSLKNKSGRPALARELLSGETRTLSSETGELTFRQSLQAMSVGIWAMTAQSEAHQ